MNAVENNAYCGWGWDLGVGIHAAKFLGRGKPKSYIRKGCVDKFLDVLHEHEYVCTQERHYEVTFFLGMRMVL